MLYHLNIYPIDTYYLQLQDYRPIHMDNGFTWAVNFRQYVHVASNYAINSMTILEKLYSLALIRTGQWVENRRNI